MAGSRRKSKKKRIHMKITIKKKLFKKKTIKKYAFFFLENIPDFYKDHIKCFSPPHFLFNKNELKSQESLSTVGQYSHVFSDLG